MFCFKSNLVYFTLWKILYKINPYSLKYFFEDVMIILILAAKTQFANNPHFCYVNVKYHKGWYPCRRTVLNFDKGVLKRFLLGFQRDFYKTYFHRLHVCYSLQERVWKKDLYWFKNCFRETLRTTHSTTLSRCLKTGGYRWFVKGCLF